MQSWVLRSFNAGLGKGREMIFRLHIGGGVFLMTFCSLCLIGNCIIEAQLGDICAQSANLLYCSTSAGEHCCSCSATAFTGAEITLSITSLRKLTSVDVGQ